MRINKTRVFLFIIIVAIIVSASMAGQAKADIQFPLDYKFSGAQPAGPSPWVTAAFTDNGSNSVRLTMSAANLSGSEFISEWYFNLSPDLTGALTFTPYDISDVDSVTPSYSVDEYKADGDGYFDIRFEFPTADGSTDRFNGGDSVIYDISYSGTGSFNMLSFNFESAPGGGQGQYESAAHIQAISGGQSGWIGNTTVVPEPISSILFIVGASTLGFKRLRKIRKG